MDNLKFLQGEGLGSRILAGITYPIVLLLAIIFILWPGEISEEERNQFYDL